MGTPVNVAISERWQSQVQATSAKAALNPDLTSEIPTQRDQIPRSHASVEYEARGLQLFNLGMVPASVTPPRTWRWAMWFTVSSSTVVLVALGVVSMQLSSPLAPTAADARQLVPEQTISEPKLVELNAQESAVTHLAQAEPELNADNPGITILKPAPQQPGSGFGTSGNSRETGGGASTSQAAVPANNAHTTTSNPPSEAGPAVSSSADRPLAAPMAQAGLTDFAATRPADDPPALPGVTELFSKVDVTGGPAVVEALDVLNNEPAVGGTHLSNTSTSHPIG